MNQFGEVSVTCLILKCVYVNMALSNEYSDIKEARKYVSCTEAVIMKVILEPWMTSTSIPL